MGSYCDSCSACRVDRLLGPAAELAELSSALAPPFELIAAVLLKSPCTASLTEKLGCLMNFSELSIHVWYYPLPLGDMSIDGVS